MQISEDNRTIPYVSYTKLLDLIIDNTLSWKNHIDKLITRFSSACYTARQIKPYMIQPTLIILYYASFHSIMNYGIIFLENSTHNSNIFKTQKRVIINITGKRNRDSCTNLFKELKILPFKLQHILSLLLFVIGNRDNFIKNLEQYSIYIYIY